MSFSLERTPLKVLQYSIQYVPEGGGSVTGGGEGIVTFGGATGESVDLCAQPITLSASRLQLTTQALYPSLLFGLPLDRALIPTLPIRLKCFLLSLRLGSPVVQPLDDLDPVSSDLGTGNLVPVLVSAPPRCAYRQ